MIDTLRELLESSDPEIRRQGEELRLSLADPEVDAALLADCVLTRHGTIEAASRRYIRSRRSYLHLALTADPAVSRPLSLRPERIRALQVSWPLRPGEAEALEALPRLHALTVRGGPSHPVGEIARLTQLRELDLSHARGLLPDISALRRLLRLTVDKVLPEGLPSLWKLRSVRMDGGSLSPLTQLRALEELDIGLVFSPDELAVVSELHGLRRLGVHYVGGRRLPEELFSAVGLERLDLTGCPLESLSPSISTLSRLKWLSLDACTLSVLPDELGELAALEYLSIQQGTLGALPDTLTDLSRLHTLRLGNNRLSALPAGMTKLTALKSLYLSDNLLQNLPRLPESLELLRLSENRLTTIPLYGLPRLRDLRLTNNRIGGFSTSIKSLTALRTLDLSDNRLTELPAWIASLPSLTRLRLARNRLTTLPGSIGGLSTLRSLDLTGNQITRLPDGLGDIPLQHLGLTWALAGSIPPVVGRLKSLRQLHLMSCGLHTLPTFLFDMTHLRMLNLWGNPLRPLDRKRIVSALPQTMVLLSPESQ